MKKIGLVVIVIAVALVVVVAKRPRQAEKTEAPSTAAVVQPQSPTPVESPTPVLDSAPTTFGEGVTEADLGKAVNQALEPRRVYIEKYGPGSLAAEIDPSVQAAFEGSEEYQAGVKSQSKAAALERAGRREEADSAYHETIDHFLEAIRQHPQADITPAVFRIGNIYSNCLTSPDCRTAYFCYTYVREANPGGKLAMFTSPLEEIQQSGKLSSQETADLDQAVKRLLAKSESFGLPGNPEGQKK